MEVETANKWVVDLTSQILVEVYAAMEEQEVEKRAKRQSEGIAVAKEKVIKFGRKPIKIDEQFRIIYAKRKVKELSAVKAMEQLGLKPNTFYREYRNN